ncbi:PREDICTED: probable disease resistance protein At5g66900-like [Fragaria vesca subsp. vesca]
MLIVTAPGGCGKTTLATKFCQDQDVKDKFQKNIFFVTFSKKPNLELIMKGLYEQKGYPVPTFQNEATDPVKWLKKVEMEKEDDPLLLILDDVWSGSESLLGKFEFRMSNYKILVTSRSEFPRFGPSYHLQLLDDDNAMELFRQTASLGDKSSHIPKDLSKEWPEDHFAGNLKKCGEVE